MQKTMKKRKVSPSHFDTPSPRWIRSLWRRTCETLNTVGWQFPHSGRRAVGADTCASNWGLSGNWKISIGSRWISSWSSTGWSFSGFSKQNAWHRKIVNVILSCNYLISIFINSFGNKEISKTNKAICLGDLLLFYRLTGSISRLRSVNYPIHWLLPTHCALAFSSH